VLPIFGKAVQHCRPFTLGQDYSLSRKTALQLADGLRPRLKKGIG
jgi:hypothetical protein